MRLFFLLGRTFKRLPFLMYQHFAIGGGHRRGTDAPQGLFAQRLAAFPFPVKESLNAYICGCSGSAHEQGHPAARKICAKCPQYLEMSR